MKKISAIVLLALALSACGSGNAPSSTSPSKSIESMWSLMAKGEVQLANKFLNKDMQNRNVTVGLAKILTKTPPQKIKAEEKNVKGDIAEVVLLIEDENGDKAKVRFDMLRENGQWVASSMIPMCSAKKDKELPC